LLIVLDRAKNGDLKSYYNALLDEHNKDRSRLWEWNPTYNEIDGKDRGIPSILPWVVLSAADRMLLVFQLSSALK
jgi:hypothetical protein